MVEAIRMSNRATFTRGARPRVRGCASHRTSLGSLVAGVQPALTDAVRVGDVVVGGEWGREGEIALSSAVVSVQDERRLMPSRAGPPPRDVPALDASRAQAEGSTRRTPT